jgi:hypothetical protein
MDVDEIVNDIDEVVDILSTRWEFVRGSSWSVCSWLILGIGFEGDLGDSPKRRGGGAL